MKAAAKSSITLPPQELRLVEHLKKKLAAKSNVEVVRRGLQLLKTSLDRQELRLRYRDASARVVAASRSEMADLDALSAEGLGLED